MKRILYLITLICLTAILKSDAQATWIPMDTLYTASFDTVYVSYYADSCQGAPAVYLKIENLSAQDITVIWSLWTGVANKSITLVANEIKEGECNSLPEWWLIDPIPQGSALIDLSPNFNLQ